MMQIGNFGSGLAIQHLAASDHSADGGVVHAAVLGDLSHCESPSAIGSEMPDETLLAFAKISSRAVLCIRWERGIRIATLRFEHAYLCAFDERFISQVNLCDNAVHDDAFEIPASKRRGMRDRKT